MATNILMCKGGTLKLGPTATATNVECQVTSAIIQATADPKELTTMCGKVTVPGVTAYVLNVDYAQDWGPTGISTFLFENDGVLVDFELIPTTSALPMAAGQCYAVPGDFGGAAGEIMVGSVSLGIDGAPTITSSATTAAAGARPTDEQPAAA